MDAAENRKYLDETIALVRSVFSPDDALPINSRTINLEPLCLLHEATDDTYNKSVFEELFALCTNTNFQESVSITRQKITDKTGVALPTNNRAGVFRCRKILHANGEWEWYQSLLRKLRDNHRLRGDPYEGDPFSEDEYSFNLDNMRWFVDNDSSLREGEGLSADELAEKLTIQEAIKERFNALECIIFFNNPVFMRGYTGIPHSMRGGTLKIENDLLTGESFIVGRFYLNSTKQDIRDIIEANFEGVAIQRKEIHHIPHKKKDAHKTKLLQQCYIHRMNASGMGPTQIAMMMEKDGISQEVDIRSVELALQRMRKDNVRFDSLKSPTS